MTSPLATGVFGLASATSWGAGDFSGGLATKRAPVFTVAAVSKLASLATMLFFAWLRAEQIPSLHVLVWAGAAGVGGAVGLMALYQALAVGVMGVAAPVSAVIAATMPVVFAALSEGLPTDLQLTGFGLAMAAVWFISRPAGGALPGRPRQTRGLTLAALAGLGFGVFYIFISRARANVVFWPLAASQLVTLVTVLAVVGILALARRSSTDRLPIDAVPLMLLAGLLDAGGNAFFLLAEHAGRLDVAAVLASLYPASTVVLARLILNERVSRTQAVGIVAALASIPLIAG
ncbi:MAG TPA: DMT family transporter [bacterium]|nr:DMT family transporter [bacterium]